MCRYMNLEVENLPREKGSEIGVAYHVWRFGVGCLVALGVFPSFSRFNVGIDKSLSLKRSNAQRERAPTIEQ